jgi:uncharacterized protein (TIGR03000 family)
MYGVVLMMAMSGGVDLPAYGDVAVDHVAKYGDHGDKQYRGCHGGRRARRCHGCCGGCYGGCSGCNGGGGCYGGGCYGGGCYGGGCYGGGCSGGCGGGAYGAYGYGAMFSGSNYYGAASYGAPLYAGTMPGQYGYGALTGPNGSAEAPATIVVRLPADARLTIGGSASSSTQDVRTFVSPPLQPGKDYQYTLTAEVTRDGKTVERSRDVTVRAGQQSEVTFDLPSSGGSSGD